MLRHVALAGMISTLSTAATPSDAANCAKRELVIDRLKVKYSEQLTAGGLQATRTATTILEVWASPETGTFTVMLTNAQGVSCIVASGTDWFAETPMTEPKGVDG